jgi:hypothetical protein
MLRKGHGEQSIRSDSTERPQLVPNEVDHAGHLQNPNLGFPGRRDLNEQIGRKQRHGNFFFPVTPAMYFRDQGKENPNSKVL